MSKEYKNLGKIYKSNGYGYYKIIERITHNTIRIEFVDTKYTRVISTSRLKDGEVKDCFKPSVCGIGYYGELGELNKKPVHLKKIHNLWSNMIRRVTDLEMFPSYKDVTVCDRWLNFSNFYSDVFKLENFDKWINDCGYCIDKDMKTDDNKVYSPDTVMFVPSCINSMEACDRRWKKHNS